MLSLHFLYKCKQKILDINTAAAFEALGGSDTVKRVWEQTWASGLKLTPKHQQMCFQETQPVALPWVSAYKLFLWVYVSAAVVTKQYPKEDYKVYSLFYSILFESEEKQQPHNQLRDVFAGGKLKESQCLSPSLTASEVVFVWSTFAA